MFNSSKFFVTTFSFFSRPNSFNLIFKCDSNYIKLFLIGLEFLLLMYLISVFYLLFLIKGPFFLKIKNSCCNKLFYLPTLINKFY